MNGYPPQQQGGGGHGGPPSSSSAHGGYSAVRTMENQNDDLMSGLHQKVAALKNVAITIGDVARDDVKYFSEINNDMGRTGIMLKNTMHRLTRLTGMQSPKQMCYLIGFILFVFFVLYWLFRR